LDQRRIRGSYPFSDLIDEPELSNLSEIHLNSLNDVFRVRDSCLKKPKVTISKLYQATRSEVQFG
jgi:hypothetical protein